MKYVALDIGNVLVNVDFSKFIKSLSKAVNITLEEANYFLNRSQKLHDLGLTEMKDELRDHFKIKSQALIDDLIIEWNNSIRPADYMLDKFYFLSKKHNVQIALLSNIGLEHSSQLRSLINNDGFFDKSVKHFSCQVGARKPSILYYQSFLQLYPEWKNCAYIDDLQENLDVSKQFGFRIFRFSLEEITGQNYIKKNYDDKMNELEWFILDK